MSEASKSVQKFANGVLVQMKSGGPAMVVVAYDSYSYVEEKRYLCEWMEKEKGKYEKKSEIFYEASLAEAGNYVA